MTTKHNMTDFDFVPTAEFVDRKKGDRRKNRDHSAGSEFFTLKIGEVQYAGRNRRKSSEDRRCTREIVDTTGFTLWTSDDDITENSSDYSQFKLP